jgi:hypothetical protein
VMLVPTNSVATVAEDGFEKSAFRSVTQYEWASRPGS